MVLSTPASLSFKGQATKHITVNWSIANSMGFEYNFRERKKQNSENSSDSSVSEEIHSTYALNITLSTKNTFQKRKGTKIREFYFTKELHCKMRRGNYYFKLHIH